MARDRRTTAETPRAAGAPLAGADGAPTGARGPREILEALPVAIYTTDAAGRITFFNQAAADLAGGRRPRLGTDHWCVTWRLYRPDGTPLPHDECPMAVALKEGRPVRGEPVIAEQPDGTRVPVRAFPTPLHDADGNVVGAVNVLMDISVEVAATQRQAQLIADLARLNARGIIDVALDAFIQMDGAGEIIEWNHQAEILFGWSRREAIGRKLRDLVIPPDQRAAHNAGLARFLRTGATTIVGRRVQLDAQCRDGRLITVELSVTALPRNGGTVFNGFIRDLTDKIAAEAQLRQSQKMEAVGQLTDGVAHDFNNLLAAIVPSIELAQERVGDPVTRKHLEAAARAARRGAKLTHQLLAFSRKQDLRLESVDVNHLVTEICDMLPRTLGPTVAVKTRLGDQMWPASTDAGQLELAILNLAINGRDAMARGGTLTIATANLAAGDGALPPQLDPGDYVVIAVSDTGRGMTEEVRNRAFEPFFSTKEVGQGTGLGLSMVYGLAHQSGGTATIESRIGHGTTVRLLFRRGRSAADPAHADNATLVTDGGPPARLLVVDDDDTVREATVALLNGFGHEVVAFDSGEAALDLLERDRAFDLLIVDLAMPHMHGGVFAMRARRLVPNVRTLFVTGYADRHWLGEISKAHVLKKPFRRVDLAEKLRAVLAAAA